MSDFINGAVFASVLILGSSGMVLFYMILHYEKAKIEWQREQYRVFEIVNKNKSRQSSGKDIQAAQKNKTL